MSLIRPNALPSGTPTNGSALIVDTGAAVVKATPVQLVDVAVPLASQAQAEAGTDNTTRTSPLRVSQAITALAANALPIATQAEAEAGTNNLKRMSPLRTAQAIAALAIGSSDTVSVFKYIPANLQAAIIANTSVVDVSSYVQQAYSQTKVEKVFFPAGRFVLGTEIDTNGRQTEGVGSGLTTLVAGTLGQRSVLKMSANKNSIRGVTIDGTASRLSNYGIYCTTTNGGRVELCDILQHRIAGCNVSDTGNNSEMAFVDCRIRLNGRRVSCGTASGSNGATTVTIAGANPTTLGIRTGYSFLKITGEVMQEITGFTSSSVSIYPGLTANRSSVTATLYDGSGLEIQVNGDNSNIKSQRNAFQDNALFGVDCVALYGLQSDGDLAENNAMSVGIGRRAAGGEKQVINWSVRGIYSETNTEGALIYHGSSREGYVENPVLDLIPNSGLDFMYIVDPVSTLRSLTAVGIEGASGSRRYYFTNISDAGLSVGQTALCQQSSGNFTVTLTPPTTGSNGSTVAAYLDFVATIILGDIGANTCTVRSTALINGIASSGGYSSKAITGSYRKLEARWKGDGWVLTGTSAL